MRRRSRSPANTTDRLFSTVLPSGVPPTGGYGFNRSQTFKRNYFRGSASYYANMLGTHEFKGGGDYTHNSLQQPAHLHGRAWKQGSRVIAILAPARVEVGCNVYQHEYNSSGVRNAAGRPDRGGHRPRRHDLPEQQHGRLPPGQVAAAAEPDDEPRRPLGRTAGQGHQRRRRRSHPTTSGCRASASPGTSWATAAPASTPATPASTRRCPPTSTSAPTAWRSPRPSTTRIPTARTATRRSAARSTHR